MYLSGVVALALVLPAAHDSANTADKARWSMHGELSFTDISGNRSLSLLTTGLGARRTGGQRYELSVAGAARYGRSAGELAVATYTSELNLRFVPRSRVSPFVRGTALHDPMRNLHVRLAMVAGAEVNVVKEGPRAITLGMALLQDYESRALPEGSDEAASISSTRFNMQLRGEASLRPGVTLGHSSQLQPVADDFGDYLLTSTTSLKVALTGALAFQTTYTFNRDATPSPGVLFKNDRTLTTGLVIELK